MNQRIVCRFCDWNTAFSNGHGYLEAKAEFDAHLESHQVEITEVLEGESCLECDTRLIPHCMNTLCEWEVCIHCKMVWNNMDERSGFCYASDDEEKRRNGV